MFSGGLECRPGFCFGVHGLQSAWLKVVAPAKCTIWDFVDPKFQAPSRCQPEATLQRNLPQNP